MAAALRALGIGKGDRLTIYMPTCPEAIILMLATVRIGAIHSVVFGGFSAQSVADRVHDCGAPGLVEWWPVPGLGRPGGVDQAVLGAVSAGHRQNGRPNGQTRETAGGGHAGEDSTPNQWSG